MSALHKANFLKKYLKEKQSKWVSVADTSIWVSVMGMNTLEAIAKFGKRRFETVVKIKLLVGSWENAKIEDKENSFII